MNADKLILIAGICVFTAVVCKLFDNGAKEYGIMIKTAAAAAVMTAVIGGMVPIIERIETMYADTGGSSEYLTILLKSLGICFLTQLAADICRDSGEGTLAVQTETAGKAALLVVALPLFEQAAELVRGLIY